MGSRSSGNPGEAAVLNALVQRGYDVLIPFGEGQPYDLVLDLPGAGFTRIQCKTGWTDKGCLRFNTYATDHGRGALKYHGLADLFGVYSRASGTVYLVPVSEMIAWEGRLRLEPTRNNQRKGVRFARDYEIDRWSTARLQRVLSGEGDALFVAA
jgi:hypothetical protein